MHGRQIHLFAVAADNHMVGAGVVALHQIGDVVIGKDVLAVDLENLVARHQTVRRVADRRIVKAQNLPCADKVAVHADQNARDDQTENQIKCRAGGHDDDPLPNLFVAKRAVVVGAFVLALHRAIAADGKQMQRIFGFFALLFENRRPHAERKLVDLDAEELCENKVSEFMDKDDHAEKENGNQKRPDLVPDGTGSDEKGKCHGVPPRGYGNAECGMRNSELWSRANGQSPNALRRGRNDRLLEMGKLYPTQISIFKPDHPPM